MEDRVDFLQEECLTGLVHYRIWNRMGNKIRESERLRDNFELFFPFTLTAHFESAKLRLIRLFDRSGDAVSLWSVLDDAEQKPGIFNADKEEVRRVVKENKRLIKNNRTRLGKLKDQRDDHFVHLSDDYFPSYEELYRERELKRKDIYELLQLASDVLNDLLGILRDAEMVMDLAREGETEKLIDLVEERLDKRERELLEEARERINDSG